MLPEPRVRHRLHALRHGQDGDPRRRRPVLQPAFGQRRYRASSATRRTSSSPSVTFGNVGLATDPTTSQATALASFNTFESSFSKGFTLSQIQSGAGQDHLRGARATTRRRTAFRPPQGVGVELRDRASAEPAQRAGDHLRGQPRHTTIPISNTTLNNFNANPAKFPTGFLGLPAGAARSAFRHRHAR